MLRHKVNIQKLIVFWHIDNEQFWKLETVLFNTTKKCEIFNNIYAKYIYYKLQNISERNQKKR